MGKNKVLFLAFSFLLSVVGVRCTEVNTYNTYFAFLSDTHIGSGNASDDLFRSIEDINSMDCVKYVFITGDITEFGSDEELLEADSLLNRLNKPWFVMPGNHDTKWSESGTNSFKTVFGYDRFTYEANGFLFIGCSSGPNMRMAPGLIPREDLVWLDSIITQNPDKPIIFLNHYPLDEGLGNYKQLESILKKGNIQSYLLGHGHRNKKYDFNGIPGTMGRSNLRARKDHGGYNLVKVTSDSLIFSERIPGQITKSPWRKIHMKNHSFRSTSMDNKIVGKNIEVIWSKKEDSDIGSGFNLYGETLYHTNANGFIKAISSSNGDIIWKFKTGGKIFSTPHVTSDKVFIASTDSIIYCLERISGEVIWKHKSGKSVVGSPATDTKRVFIGGSDGKFKCLDKITGKLIWEYDQLGNFVETTPAIDEQNVYFGAWDTYFYALNKFTGELKWKWTKGHPSRMYSPAACIPVIDDERVYFVAPDRIATAINKKTGEVIWRSDRAVGRESISFNYDSTLLLLKSMQDTLFAISASNDYKIVKKIFTPMDYEISPTPSASFKNAIFLPTDKGNIFIIDQRSTKNIASVKLGNGLINQIRPLSENEFIATSMDGVIARIKIKEATN